MTELWWCLVCQRDRRFGVFDINGFSWLSCQSCGQSMCLTPEPIPEPPTEEDVA